MPDWHTWPWVGVRQNGAYELVWLDGGDTSFVDSPVLPHPGCGIISEHVVTAVPCDQLRPTVCEMPCAAGQDSDGDGYLACGDDCDDDDPTTHPGAPDQCFDGDHNCDGVCN